MKIQKNCYKSNKMKIINYWQTLFIKVDFDGKLNFYEQIINLWKKKLTKWMKLFLSKCYTVTKYTRFYCECFKLKYFFLFIWYLLKYTRDSSKNINIFEI